MLYSLEMRSGLLAAIRQRIGTRLRRAGNSFNQSAALTGWANLWRVQQIVRDTEYVLVVVTSGTRTRADASKRLRTEVVRNVSGS